MKTSLAYVLIALASLGTGASAIAAQPQDPVLASFERILTDPRTERFAAAPVARPQEHDPLRCAVSMVLWGEQLNGCPLDGRTLPPAG